MAELAGPGEAHGRDPETAAQGGVLQELQELCRDWRNCSNGAELVQELCRNCAGTVQELRMNPAGTLQDLSRPAAGFRV